MKLSNGTRSILPRQQRAAVFLVLALLAAAATSASIDSSSKARRSNADRVQSVPGFPGGQVPFVHYSGFLDIGPERQKHFHYWLVDAENAADAPSADKPLILWLNGGPGCSSLYGGLREMGPLNFNFLNRSDETVYLNPWSWHRVATVLFVESPVGVGFTYSDQPSDYHTDDTRTAEDNLAVLLAFYARYPEHKKRRLFISGESYAGIYIPTLALAIQAHNARAGSSGARIPLEGLLIGNGVTHPTLDTIYESHVRFFHGHGQISEQVHDAVLDHCAQDRATPACEAAVAAMRASTAELNRYQIYTPCISTPRKFTLLSEEDERQQRKQKKKQCAREAAACAEAADLWELDEMTAFRGEVPCVDSTHMNRYLNDAVVRRAFHVSAFTGRWSICSDTLRYTQNLGRDSFQFYPSLLKDYRVWVFYGDTDAAVTHRGGELWTQELAAELNLKPSEAWRPWSVAHSRFGKQVGGMVQSWATQTSAQGFAFVTVRGGWHTVPESNPEESFKLIQAFLADSLL